MGHKRKHLKLQIIICHCDCPKTRSIALKFTEFIFIKCLSAGSFFTFIFSFYTNEIWMFPWRTKYMFYWERTWCSEMKMGWPGIKNPTDSSAKESQWIKWGGKRLGHQWSTRCRAEDPPRRIPIAQVQMCLSWRDMGLVMPDFFFF